MDCISDLDFESLKTISPENPVHKINEQESLR